jgi:sec-independent protein translocase protein TatB
MFDIGFSELLVIGVVALVVIGPERLPKVARTLGHLFGRLQRYVTQVKSDINREMDLSELKSAKTEFENAARSFKSDIESKASEAERELRGIQEQVDKDVAASPPAEAATAGKSDGFARGLLQEPDTFARELIGEPQPDPAPAKPQLELGIEDNDAMAAPKPRSGP